MYGDKFVERDDYLRWRWKRHGSKGDPGYSPIEDEFEELRHVLANGSSPRRV